MSKIHSHKDLLVWQKSMSLVKEVYELTSKLPKNEIYGISSQMQRAAVSIPSNIAEGSMRPGRADFPQFCSIALGSAAELETQLLLVADVYPSVSTKHTVEKSVEIQKMLHALIKKLKP